MALDCGCILVTFRYGDWSYVGEVFPVGEHNGYSYYQFIITDDLTGTLYYDGAQWVLSYNGLDGVGNAASGDTLECPQFVEFNLIQKIDEFSIRECRVCRPIQDRTQKKYPAVKLPVLYEEEDRGFKMCCDCPMLVLAGGPTDSWKNDVTSAWIKLSGPSDLVDFILTKNDQVINYTPTISSFVNEDNAYYTTIQWRDVLAQDGIGCYKLEVKYNIGGLEGGFIWGVYDLRPYTIQNALKTARIRVKFNLKHQIEGINFTGSNVEDCIRFNGFIGERQPNTEIDNLIYQDRTMKSVVRENLDTYIITTDPLQECFIRPLTDLYLLSENEMWISDYNAHNHSYRIQDIPVILEESPEIDYLDIWQRRAKLTAKVGLKTKNRRTFY